MEMENPTRDGNRKEGEGGKPYRDHSDDDHNDDDNDCTQTCSDDDQDEFTSIKISLQNDIRVLKCGLSSLAALQLTQQLLETRRGALDECILHSLLS